MVVLLVDPSTRMLSPVVTAPAEALLVPLSYVVEDASLTVTFWPADVVRVNPDPDTLSTVPDDPPAAGPDRALAPPAPALPCPAADEDGVADGVAVAEGAEAAAEGDVEQAVQTPNTAPTRATVIPAFLLFDGNLRVPERSERGGTVVMAVSCGSAES
jgi:hypothetical protein